MTSFAIGAERIVGADISMLPELEKAGAVYKDGGKPGDAVILLRSRGVNLFRLRVFVNPTTDFKKSWGATQDLKMMMALAKRIKSAGGKILLDLHYSDTWADPEHQTKPAAWKELPLGDLTKQVHDYTADVLASMAKNETPPDMIQIGNEIAAGMLWPDGKLYEPGASDELKQQRWDNLALLLKSGIAAARAFQPDSQKMQIMIHIHGGGQKDTPTWFFRKLDPYKLDYDIIGLSFYPVSGESIDLLQSNIAKLIGSYGKEVIVAEVSYPWKPVDYADKHKDTTPWLMTPVGQQKFVADLDAMLRAQPGGKATGFIWWYPEATPVKGISVWRNGAEGLFDEQGNILPTLNATNH